MPRIWKDRVGSIFWQRYLWIHPLLVGQMLRSNPSDSQFIGAGRRASTLRALVRYVRNFFKWLSSAHQKTYPTEVSDLTNYLKVRRDEPCNRGALRNVRRCFEFLEEVTCTQEQQKLTKTELFQLMSKEVSAEPGRPTKQAPRMFLSVIAGLEKLVVSQSAAPSCSNICMVDLLATLGDAEVQRSPRHLSVFDQVSGIDCSAVLSHSKTLGKDKQVQSRPVVVHGPAFLTAPDWLRVGWDLLRQIADFPRDYLLPSPSSCLRGCLRSELRYETGSAVFYRTLCLVQLPGDIRLPSFVAHYWTPHSGRAFLLSCTSALKVEKTTRDFLGG